MRNIAKIVWETSRFNVAELRPGPVVVTEIEADGRVVGYWREDAGVTDDETPVIVARHDVWEAEADEADVLALFAELQELMESPERQDAPTFDDMRRNLTIYYADGEKVFLDAAPYADEVSAELIIAEFLEELG